MERCNEIESRMMAMRDDEQACILMRFFKCGDGEYGEGDKFLGIKVPRTREIVKEFRDMVSLEDVMGLTRSPWHEIRLAGFLLMIEVYRRAKKKKPEDDRRIVDCYLRILGRGNNWDLVDLVAPYILGDWLITRPEERGVLDELADMHGNLWHQRAAMVTTWMLIREGVFDCTFRIAEKYLNHPHDLIHKATGWMLREVGKRGGEKDLKNFLTQFATNMPRTMLRYAIEKLSADERKHFMNL